MIQRFRHRGLERFFRSGDTSGINAQHAGRLRRMLGTLNTCTGPAGMNLPGYRLHRLHGTREGQWAVSVSANWRLVFEFEVRMPAMSIWSIITKVAGKETASGEVRSASSR